MIERAMIRQRKVSQNFVLVWVWRTQFDSKSNVEKRIGLSSV